jgi:hypothetical protein
MGTSAKNLTPQPIQITFNNPHPHAGGQRATLTRNFYVYLELTMQCKHDGLLRGYCPSIGVVARKKDGTQVQYADATPQTALAGFYTQKARIAAEVACDHMAGKWRRAVAPVFTPGTRVDASVQNQVQHDRHQYKLSHRYDGQDIYVLFHVYSAR